MNTVQTDTRRRCSNTPSLAALPIATTLRSHHRAHSRSRHRTTPGIGTTATLTGVNRLSRIVYRDMAEASVNHKQYTINARYADTPCRHQGAHRGRQSPCGLQPTLRVNAEYRWARLSWRHPTGTNSLRSLEPSPCGRGLSCHGFAHPLRAAAALSAAHLRATHSPDDMRPDIANDTRTSRHTGLSA